MRRASRSRAIGCASICINAFPILVLTHIRRPQGQGQLNAGKEEWEKKITEDKALRSSDGGCFGEMISRWDSKYSVAKVQVKEKVWQFKGVVFIYRDTWRSISSEGITSIFLGRLTAIYVYTSATPPAAWAKRLQWVLGLVTVTPPASHAT